jgi:hypothetical protein
MGDRLFGPYHVAHNNRFRMIIRSDGGRTCDDRTRSFATREDAEAYAKATGLPRARALVKRPKPAISPSITTNGRALRGRRQRRRREFPVVMCKMCGLQVTENKASQHLWEEHRRAWPWWELLGRFFVAVRLENGT